MGREREERERYNRIVNNLRKIEAEWDKVNERHVLDSTDRAMIEDAIDYIIEQRVRIETMKGMIAEYRLMIRHE